jgi:hypothetical protein
MTAALDHDVDHVDALMVFEARCEARSYLVAAGEIELRDAIDELQRDAERSGLIKSAGQDRVQAIMAHYFDEVAP